MTRPIKGLLPAADPLWYKDAIIYEIPVRSFFDANGDGTGDFQGLIEKLDYVQDLGVTAVWLLPFYPSPLRDGGYDIADYTDIHPMYGNMDDFKRFLDEAHKRGVRVITELVINHTSTDHPWFQRARRSPPGSAWRDFYVWSDTADRFQDARIIFQDFETSNWTWDPLARAYYWHRFYSHQPDLNFDNPAVKAALFEVLDFWMALGVDGLRLDAIPYIFERQGTNCENLPETHDFLKELRAHIDARYADKMLLAEANQWPEDAAAYFGRGDECHMNFHFPLMPRMFMSVQLESSFPILDILEQTPRIPENCQWAIFLRNHDELTLEMVTDEDRDFMYRMYADDPRARINLGIRRRLAPLLKERRKIELMNALLLSMPGTPVLYYGDELGMGDNIYLGDRDGVRTPMQWSADRNGGFSRTNPQRLYLPVIIDPEYHTEAINVEAQQNNSFSLLWWMKRIIALRKQHQVFGRGGFDFLRPNNNKVLAFFRHDDHERVLVVANLSRHSQFVELDLKQFEGRVPVEMFGHTEFPPVTDKPYVLTLAPHSFYWLLFDTGAGAVLPAERDVPRLTVAGGWMDLLSGGDNVAFQKLLGRWLIGQRWYRAKARKRRSVRIADVVSLEPENAALVVLQIEYVEGDTELYTVALAAMELEPASHDAMPPTASMIARVVSEADSGREMLLFDGASRPGIAKMLAELIATGGRLSGRHGSLRGIGGEPLRALMPQLGEPRALSAEQSNTSIAFGDVAMFKLLRVLEPGIHPEEEVGRFLSRRAQFSRVPELLGTIHYESTSGSAMAAIVQRFVPSHGDAWRLTLDLVRSSFDRVLEQPPAASGHPPSAASVIALSKADLPIEAADLLGGFMPLAEQLGRRVGELHVALATETEDPAFVPEPFSLLHQRSLYQSARSSLIRTFDALEKSIDGLPENVRPQAAWALSKRAEIDERLKRIHRKKLEATRIRCHGDLHLGQVLHTGSDFVIVDFEGEPARSLAERRFKRNPLRDVAGMLRSLHYASMSGLRDGTDRPEDTKVLEPWAEAWAAWSSGLVLKAWLQATAERGFVPADDEELTIMLDFYLLEKCIYEVGYELQNRPAWIEIPINGLRSLLAH